MKVKNMVNEHLNTYQKLCQSSKKNLTNGLLSSIVALAIAIISSLFNNAVFACIFSIVSLVISGGEYFSKLIKSKKSERNDDTILIIIAVLLIFLSGNFDVSALAMSVYKLTNIIIMYSKGALGTKIKQDAEVLPEYANIIDEGGNVRYVPSNTIMRGMKIMVKTGDVVPVDAIVSDGFSEFDTSNVFMDNKKVSLSSGDKVLAGFINEGPSVTLEAVCNFSESLTNDLTLLSSMSENSVTKAEKRFLKIAKYYPLALIVLALVVIVVTGISDGRWENAMLRAGVLLTVATTGSYVVAVPLISSCAVWNLKKKGLSIASGDLISEFADITTIAFEKNGVLTDNEYEITETYTADGISEDDFLMIAAACIGGRAHPISNIFSKYQNKYLNAENVMEFSGKGVECTIMEKTFILGNESFIKECGIDIKDALGYTIYISIDGNLLGAVKLSDSLKPDTKYAIRDLKAIGVGKLVMFSSENGEKVKEAFENSDADEYFENLTANERATKINQIKENADETVAYIGSSTDSEQAKDAADVAITLISKYDNCIEYNKAVLLGNLDTVVDAIQVSRLASGKTEIHFYCASAVKIILAILGLFGTINLVWAIIIEAILTGVALLSSYDLLKK